MLWTYERLAQDGADAHAGVERGVGVLEHHLQVAAAAAQGAAVQADDVLVLEARSRPSVGRLERDDRARPMVVLPQPDSPTSPKVSPCRMAKRHVRYRLDRPDLALDDGAGRDGELLDDVLDADEHGCFDEGVGPGRRGGPGRPRRPSTLRSAALATASGRLAMVVGVDVDLVEARREVIAERVAGGDERGLVLAAVVLGVAAARREAAVRDGLGEIGRQARDADEADGGVLVELGDRGEQRLGVRVAHGGEELGRACGLGDLARRT